MKVGDHVLAGELIVYNPLPVAYTHREKQLRAVFGDGITFIRTENEGLAGFARVVALIKHLRVVRMLKKSRRPVLVTWPLLGWVELAVWASRDNAIYLSVHDPRPLRKQVGLGRTGRWLANVVPVSRRPSVICHSSVAAEATSQIVPGTRITLLPLPMTAPRQGARRVDGDHNRVLVLGQYKPARDLEILQALAPHLSARGLTGVIAGRGWPAVDGWDVHDRFLSEDDFDRELIAAGCLVVPYRHYFQSGVALRAVELGTPVVGAHHPFLCESLGLESTPGIVTEPESVDAWVQAIESSMKVAPDQSTVFLSVQRKWQSWLTRAAARSRAIQHRDEEK